MAKYKVQHIGYPTTQAIREDQWVLLSEHRTESAAWKRVARATAHLEYGSWDDHYRVIGPDGEVCSQQAWLNQQAQRDFEREVRRQAKKDAPW